MTLNPVAAVTAAIVARSQTSRSAYLQRLQQAQAQRPQRGALGCTNLAHGFAAAPANDKLQLHPNCAGRIWRLFRLQRHAVGAPAAGGFFRSGSNRPHAALAPPRNLPAACRRCVMA